MFPAFTAIVPEPVTPVAVNVTGLPVRLPLVAVSVFVPTVVPSVQLPTVAIPFALVVAALPVMEPQPDATANVTATPLFGLLNASLTITLGATGSVEPAGAV